MTLARLGIGAFSLADPDRFEVPNFNRQHGATTRSLGRAKVEVMAEEAQAINPGVDLRLFPEAITEKNVSALLDGVDVFVDGIDFFALEARRLIFREARRRGIWAVTAGPIGLSTAWLVFSPTGMSFDDYFGFDDCGDWLETIVSFLTGLAPRATQRGYLNMARVNSETGRGPSAGLACQLCAGVAAAEVMKILLHRGPVRPAPWSFQFDAYLQRLVRAHLPRGNRTPWRRFVRKRIRKRLQGLGWRQPGGEDHAPQPRHPVGEDASDDLPPAGVGEAHTGGDMLIRTGRLLIRAACRAPSPDNNQPWGFRQVGHSIEVYHRRDRAIASDVCDMFSYIALGAALENLSLAASAIGLKAEVDYRPRPFAVKADGELVATVRLFDGGPVDPLSRFIETRVTNRRPYDRTALPEEEIAALSGAAAASNLHLYWLRRREELRTLARLIAVGDRVRFEHEPFHVEIHRALRYSEEEAAAAGDGLSLRNLADRHGFCRSGHLYPPRDAEIKRFCSQQA